MSAELLSFCCCSPPIYPSCLDFMKACFNTTDVTRFPRYCRVSGFFRWTYPQVICCGGSVFATDEYSSDWTWIGAIDLSDPLLPVWRGTGNTSLSQVTNQGAVGDFDNQCGSGFNCFRSIYSSTAIFSGTASCSGFSNPGVGGLWQFLGSPTADSGSSSLLQEYLNKCCSTLPPPDPCVTFSENDTGDSSGVRSYQWQGTCNNPNPIGSPLGVGQVIPWGPFQYHIVGCPSSVISYDSASTISFY